jgi:hypothetical protein
VRPNKLACPSCSSRGVRPSSEHGPLDWLFRLAGRAPYRCLWCRKRCFLVPPEEGFLDSAASVTERQSESVHAYVHPRRESPTPDSPPMRAENGRVRHENGENLSEAATMISEPESTPALPLSEIRVPEAPPMYAENGRLRLSGITLEQIQWRGESRLRRPRPSSRNRDENSG